MFKMKMFCHGSGFVFLVNEDHVWGGIIMLKYFKGKKKEVGYDI